MSKLIVGPAVSLIVLSGIFVLAMGCRSRPYGDSGGRVGIHTMTPGERNSNQMRIGDLASTSDTVAMSLGRDINRLVDEEFGGYRVMVVCGDIVNKSGTMPTSDFEYVRRRIRTKLGRSGLFRDNINFVESRARMERLNRREFGAGEEDLLQEGRSSGVAIKRISPDYTFYLNGDVYGIRRGGTNAYYITFALHRASDGGEVFSQDYEVKYVR